jgi:hypothetical protein
MEMLIKILKPAVTKAVNQTKMRPIFKTIFANHERENDPVIDQTFSLVIAEVKKLSE